MADYRFRLLVNGSGAGPQAKNWEFTGVDQQVCTAQVRLEEGDVVTISLNDSAGAVLEIPSLLFTRISDEMP